MDNAEFPDNTSPTSPAGLPLPAAAASPGWSGIVTLDHWALIRAAGSEAAQFLHGQLSNDFSKLGPGDLRLAGFCSAKGRLQASFLGWQAEAETLLLACHESVLAATLKRMSMFVLRSKCKLSEASSEAADGRLVCSGLVGAAADRALAAVGLNDAKAWQQRSVEGGSLLHLPAVKGLSRAVWVAAPGLRAPGAGADDDGVRPTLDNWRWLELHSGVPTIEAETADKFVPQMINFELVGGVDFQKGCYPGQEVVARSQYRGTVKRRMFLFDANAVCMPGQEVFHSSDAGQPAGMVVNGAPRPSGSGESALVEIKLAAVEDGSVHLDSVDGPLLTRVDLPYVVAPASEN